MAVLLSACGVSHGTPAAEHPNTDEVTVERTAESEEARTDTNEPAGAPTTATTSRRLPRSDRLPNVLLTRGNPDEDALFAGEDDDAAGVGLVERDVVVFLEGPIARRTRIGFESLHEEGPGITALGLYIDRARLGAVVLQDGPLPGSPVLLSRGHRVRVVGPGSEAGVTRVEVVPWEVNVGALGRYTGELPTASLGVTTPEDAALHYSGLPQVITGRRELVMLDGPAGAEVARVTPPGEVSVQVLDTQGRFQQVLLGTGPYIQGWVPRARVGSRRYIVIGEIVVDEEGPPWRIVEEGEGALHTVAAGTEVRHDGWPIARLNRSGWARVLSEGGTDAEVLVAVDDTVTLRGTVSQSALTPAPAP